MQHSKRFLAIAVVASLLGSSVAWAVALRIAPLGAYEVSLHLDDGRFAIVLDRRAPSDRTSGHGDPAMNDGDGLHDEWVVTVATLDACSTTGAGQSAKICGLPVFAVQTAEPHLVTVLAPRPVGSRAGPLVPASFSILRI